MPGAPLGGFERLQFKWFTDPARHIPASKLPAIPSAVSAACPGLAATTDHVIENPARCGFNPAVLACQGPETDRCLTPPQLETLRTLYAGASLPSGTLLYRGFAPGAEAGMDENHFRSGPGPGVMFRCAVGFFRDFVFEDPSWDYNTYDPERDGALTDRKLAAILNATNSDLTSLAARGGKLILYHGWNDSVVPHTGRSNTSRR